MRGAGRIRGRDWMIGVGVAAIVVVSQLARQDPPSDLDPLGYALLVVGGLSLFAHRSSPIIVLAVTGLSALGYQAAGFEAPLVAYLFAVYATVRAGHRIVAVTGSVIMMATLPLAILASSPAESIGEAFAQSQDALPLAWLIAAGAAGEAVRQAERRADDAERNREETARRRADEERLYIARELHDSLTHQISVIKVQAEVAVHLAGRRGEQVPEALLAIREAVREAARELRATLDVLRSDDERPQRGLDSIPELVRQARTTGLDAKLTVHGQRRDTSAAVDRTAYRIVQESLTNIARHAGASTATVGIDYRADAVVIRVDDDGRATSDMTPLSGGVGLRGMRERVNALGGRLQAVPRSEGGFTVHAELPTDRTA